MNILYIIVLSVVLAILFLWLYFKINTIKINKSYVNKVVKMEQEIRMHKSQIFHRQQALNRYDFLKYNISEALLIQFEIRL